MPLPDERRPGKASDLIKRFQAAVDTNKEAPLQVSSSFASPSRPRISSGGTPSVINKKVEGIVAGIKTEEGAKIEGTDPKDVKSEQVHIRSAGLDHPPSVPVEQRGRKNAQEAFPNMQPAPTQAQADALASRAESQDQPSNLSEPTHDDRSKSPSTPPIAVTQPSVDVPPQEAVPGSTDSIAPRSPSPSPVEAASEPREPTPERLSPTPTSPIVPDEASTKAKEGLSRPTSPSADPSHLRSPPATDDNSPPPSRSLSPELPPSPPVEPTESTNSEPESKAPSSPVHPPSSNSISKPLPKPSSSTSTPRKSTSPTQSRTRTTLPTTQKLSPTSSRKPLPSSSSTSPTHARTSTSTSPTSSRSLLTPTASSLAKARPRVNSISSSTTGGSSNTSPTRTRSKPSSPSSSRMSPSNSRTGSSAGAGSGEMKRSSSAQSTGSNGSKVSALSNVASSRGGGAHERNGKPAGVMMAKRGRIGLAGAGATRPATSTAGGTSKPDGDVTKQNDSTTESQDTSTSSSSTSTNSEKPLPSLPPPSSPSSPNPNQPSSSPASQSIGEKEVDLESIPVFDPNKFGGRPHGRIPIPMEMRKDPETGEEKMMAKQPKSEGEEREERGD